MKFIPNRNNVFPGLVELRADLVEGDQTAGTIDLVVELRIHPREISEDIGDINIEIKEAILSLSLDGLEIIPKSKRFQPVAESQFKTEIQTERTIAKSSDRENSTSGGAEVNASNSGLGGKAEAKRSRTEKQGSTISEKETRKTVEVFDVIKAIGNDQWSIKNPNGAALDAVYIDYDPICTLRSTKGANRLGSCAELIVYQKHLKAELTNQGRISRFLGTNNQKKIFEILLAKCLNSHMTPLGYDGKLIFSKAECYEEE